MPFPKLPAMPNSSGHWELAFTTNSLTSQQTTLLWEGQTLKRACPLAFRNFAPLLSQCSVIFRLACFHLGIFFRSPLTQISCQSPVPISTVWASSAAAKWQDPVTDDRNICVEEDDRAAMAEELCKASNSPKRWQHFE